jgi:hypothetical protein
MVNACTTKAMRYMIYKNLSWGMSGEFFPPKSPAECPLFIRSNLTSGYYIHDLFYIFIFARPQKILGSIDSQIFFKVFGDLANMKDKTGVLRRYIRKG